MNRDAEPVQVLFGLGANVGDPLGQIFSAVRRLGEWVADLRVSTVYRSEPVGFEAQPDFYNLVAVGFTVLSPAGLLATTRKIEDSLGRERRFANQPRTIDIDILAYGDRVLQRDELVIPHPRLHERAFVLVPLAEIAPAWRHPLFGATPAELLAAAVRLEKVERWGALPGWSERLPPSGA